MPPEQAPVSVFSRVHDLTRHWVDVSVEDCCSLADQSHFTSPGLSFLICEIGAVIVPSLRDAGRENIDRVIFFLKGELCHNHSLNNNCGPSLQRGKLRPSGKENAQAGTPIILRG